MKCCRLVPRGGWMGLCNFFTIRDGKEIEGKKRRVACGTGAGLRRSTGEAPWLDRRLLTWISASIGSGGSALLALAGAEKKGSCLRHAVTAMAAPLDITVSGNRDHEKHIPDPGVR
jgi:hypothetical protein